MCDPDKPRLSAGSNLIYGERPARPVLGRFYRAPDLPRNYAHPTILDTSLSHIAVYAHLRTHDLEPVPRPSTPPILSELRATQKEDAVSRKSSRITPSTVRTSTLQEIHSERKPQKQRKRGGSKQQRLD